MNDCHDHHNAELIREVQSVQDFLLKVFQPVQDAKFLSILPEAIRRLEHRQREEGEVEIE